MLTAFKPLIKRLHPKHKSEVVSAGPVGYQDAMNNGWFNHHTGELAVGFPISADDVLVDVGCGDGGLSYFAGQMGATIIGTDIDAKCVESARRMLAKTKAKSFTGIVSDSNPLPMQNGTCTRVICSEVLEHVPDPAKFLQELIRVAAPGALFLLAVPDPASEAVQKDLAPPSYWESPNHLRVFETGQFDALIMQAGLTIEQRVQKSFFWSMWWTLFWAADQQFGEAEKPILQHWSETWNALMQCESGLQVSKRLDLVMPKSQVIVARKPI